MQEADLFLCNLAQEELGGEVGTHSHIHNFQLNLHLSINLRIPLEGCVVAMAGGGRLAMVVE